MTGWIPLPGPTEVAELWSTLVGQTVSVSELDDVVAWMPGRVEARYVTDDGQLAVTVVADWLLAAAAAAALALLPASSLDDDVSQGPLRSSEVLWDGWCEVANVTAKLLHHDHSPHVRLDRVVDADSEASAPGPVSKCRSFVVEIDRYGTGRLTFLVW